MHTFRTSELKKYPYWNQYVIIQRRESSNTDLAIADINIIFTEKGNLLVHNSTLLVKKLAKSTFALNITHLADQLPVLNDCSEVARAGGALPGYYLLDVDMAAGQKPYNFYCDEEGWTYFIVRTTDGWMAVRHLPI